MSFKHGLWYALVSVISQYRAEALTAEVNKKKNVDKTSVSFMIMRWRRGILEDRSLRLSGVHKNERARGARRVLTVEAREIWIWIWVRKRQKMEMRCRLDAKSHQHRIPLFCEARHVPTNLSRFTLSGVMWVCFGILEWFGHPTQV